MLKEKEINKNTSLLSTSAIFILSSILTGGISFLSTPIFTRLMTPADYGVTAVYTTWVSIFINFIGLQTLGTIAPARMRFEKREFNQYLSSILFLSFISFLIISCVVIFFKENLKTILNLPDFLIWVMLFHSFFAYVQNFYNIYLVQMKQAIKSLVLSVGYSIASVGLGLYITFHIQENLFMGKILGNAAIVFIIGLVLFLIILIRGKKFISVPYWKYCLPLAIPNVLSSISALILGQSDKIMVQNFCGNNEVGLYSLAYTIASIVTLLWNATNNAWVPWYFDKTKEKMTHSINQYVRKYIEIISFFLCAVMFASPEIIRIMGSEVYWSAGKLIPVVMLGQYFYFLSMFSVNFEIFAEKAKWIALGAIVAAGLNLFLNFYIIPIFGGLGAAMTTLISYIVLFIMHLIVASRMEGFNIKTNNLFRGILIVSIGFIFSLVFYDWFIPRWILILGLIFWVLYNNKDLIRHEWRSLFPTKRYNKYKN